MTQTKEKFQLQRTFNASKEAVFQAFSNAEALAQWWGPVEAPIDVVKLEFKPNGIFHYKMKGDSMRYGMFKYLSIEEPNSISWINSFANEHAEIIKPPFDGIDFPKEIMNNLQLTEENGITTLTLTGYPINATEEEEKTYYAFTEGMQKGFTGTLNQLENYLARAK